MEKTISNAEALNHDAKGFNFAKLQAVLCMAASAAVSISLLVWACKSFL
ncbi:hypothetical protein SAMN06265795_11472 [Noviherbaspirillum humi]|uniref:Uncharacterized protein n=1 Tax=Noviherbaspirillum humi TaxID=1688639 RepID=A0A239K0K6_9BURK|nr:hypothetical protein [Noviherbaspirillum humi]SNT11535.1 hypothetical protein SAMN06265795_11472 [Noviherbaspirillum humi]